MNKFKSMAIEGYVKNKYPQYFTDGAFKVDLNVENGSCAVTATLAGESEPVTINIKKYEIAVVGAVKFLKITDVDSDRIWLKAMLTDHLLNKKIPVPSLVASVLQA